MDITINMTPSVTILIALCITFVVSWGMACLVEAIKAKHNG